MQNYEINEFAAQSSITQVASYFDIVDNAVKTGDTNKRYSVTTNACNAPACPIKNGGWTSFVISPQGDNMCDLYNSFITVHMKVKIRGVDGRSFSNKKKNAQQPMIWVGFKDSMDCISQYQLLANGQAFYTQSNALEESYITNLATPESVKQSDIFSKVRHKDIWKYKIKDGRMGCYLGTSDNDVEKDIYLKIDIRRFLPLSTIKMLPQFAGNFEIRVKLSSEGMVCTPVGPQATFGRNLCSAPAEADGSIAGQTNKFMPIGTELTAYKSIDMSQSGASYCTTGKFTPTVSSFEVVDAFSHLSSFGLDDNLYQSLVNRYTKESLSFPVPTLTFQGMNGQPARGGAYDFTLTATPRFVDTIYLLLQKNQAHKTCYENPGFTNFTLKMGSYGVIPDIQYESTSAAFYELCCNAFNTNNDLAGFSKDVKESLVSSKNTYTGSESLDVSNFVMAFPVSTDFTYQQGQTSNSPITYQLKAASNSDSPFYENTSCIPVMGFLKDSVLAIQLRPVGPPIVALDDYDITSPSE